MEGGKISGSFGKLLPENKLVYQFLTTELKSSFLGAPNGWHYIVYTSFHAPPHNPFIRSTWPALCTRWPPYRDFSSLLSPPKSCIQSTFTTSHQVECLPHLCMVQSREVCPMYMLQEGNCGLRHTCMFKQM